MTNEILQIPAQIVDVNLKGKNIRLKVDVLQELTPDDELMLLQVRDKVGYFVFKPEKMIEEDIISLPEKYDIEKGKSPAQRLRSTLFVFWKQKLESKGQDFDSFYLAQMNRFIESVKEKLEPEDDMGVNEYINKKGGIC